MYSARLLATHSIRIFPFHFPSRASRCAIWFRTCHTTLYCIQSQKRPGLKTCSISVCLSIRRMSNGQIRGFFKKFPHFFFLTLLIKNVKNKLHHFSIQSPCFAMHFFPASYQLFNGISKYVFGWARSHWCTTAFTSSSHENHLAFLSGPKRWKSDGAKFGL